MQLRLCMQKQQKVHRSTSYMSSVWHLKQKKPKHFNSFHERTGVHYALHCHTGHCYRTDTCSRIANNIGTTPLTPSQNQKRENLTTSVEANYRPTDSEQMRLQSV